MDVLKLRYFDVAVTILTYFRPEGAQYSSPGQTKRRLPRSAALGYVSDEDAQALKGNAVLHFMQRYFRGVFVVLFVL